MNEQEDLDKIQITRLLHFVSREGSCCSAIVTATLGGGLVNVTVFPDSHATWRETSIPSNHKSRVHGTWHWPRECEDMNA